MASGLNYLATPGLGGYLLGGKPTKQAASISSPMPGSPMPPEEGDDQSSWIQQLIDYLGGPLAPSGGKGWADKLKSFAFGESGGPRPFQQYSPTGASVLDQLAKQGLTESQFAPIAEQARTKFQTQTVPSIVERFQGMPGSNRFSSGLAGQLGSAGAGLEQGLAALQSQYGLQKAGMGARPQYAIAQSPGSQGAIQALLPYLPMLLGGL